MIESRNIGNLFEALKLAMIHSLYHRLLFGRHFGACALRRAGCTNESKLVYV